MNSKNTVLFQKANVLTMEEESLLNGYDVLVENGVITAIGRDLSSENARVIDCRGKTLLPSLFDSHTHIIFKDTLPLFLAYGITTVVNMCGQPCHLRWKKEIEEGRIIAPDLITAGPIIDGTEKFHQGFSIHHWETLPVDEEFPGILSFPGIIAAPDAESARRAVRYTKAAGYAYVKAYNHMEREAHDALFDEAQKLGIPVIGHYDDCINSDQIKDLMPADYDVLQRTVAHIIFVNEQNIEKMLAFGTYLDPTLIVEEVHFGTVREEPAYQEASALLNPAIAKQWKEANLLHQQSYRGPHVKYRTCRRGREWYHEMIRRYEKAGGRIIAGTDGGMEYMLPGYTLVRELAYYVEAGLSNFAALKTATVNPAQCFGLEKELGTVKKGKRANLLVLDGNPLENIRALEKPALVVKDGVPYDRAFLDNWCEQLRTKPAEEMETV